MSWIKGFLISLQFFTSIPVPAALPMDKAYLRKAIAVFPIMGLFQGVIYTFILYALVNWTPFSALACALAVWLAGIILTGGLHLDGWMDASDAFFSYRDKEKRLEIMKDPRTGAFGVLSVMVLLSVKFFFIYEITILSIQDSFFLIALIPFFGKMAIGLLLMRVQAARRSGLGFLFQQAASRNTMIFYLVYVLLLFIPAFLLAGPVLAGFLAFIALLLLIFLVLPLKIRKWFGGLTGDVLGASAEGTEAALWMALWLLHYCAMD